MKQLRNKKTGEVFDALIREKGGGGSYSLIVCDIKAYEQSKSTLNETHFILDEYDSLAELNEEWEDYEPTEPLIKDEKIRKAVRAWADANDFEDEEWLTYNRARNGLCSDLDRIEFDSITALVQLQDGRTYTIAELCGEEDE